ncbi:Ig-like domain-containing protein, partial [Pantoea agglomerans]
DVVVEATDEAGNSNSVVIDGPADSTPPDNQTSGLVIDSITLTDDVGAITGEILDGSVTDDARPTFSGDATADIDHVNIYDNGQLIGSAAVGADGKWSWTPEQDMADGTSHDLTVAAVDAAGNEGPQVSGTDDDGWSFTVDTTAPDIDAFTDSSITLTDDVGPVRGEIADGATTDDARPTYSGSVSTAGIAQGVVIYAQRFDANDNRVGREFLVNTTTSGNQGTGGDSVDATHIFDAVLTADGSVYVTWQSDNVDGSGTGIEGIVIDVDAAFYSEYTVNTTTTGAQTVSSVASLPDGGAIVVWQSASGDGSGSCVKGQLLDAKGQPVGAEFTVNTTTAGDQITPQVTVLSDGTFQVVWSTDSGAHIKGQGYTYSYDGAGNVNGLVADGTEFSVNSGTTASKLTEPAITSLEDGGYLVVWQASLNGNWAIYSRQYDANGTPVTAETVLITTSLSVNGVLGFGADWEPLPSVTLLKNGQVAIAYTVKGTGYDAGVSIYDPSLHEVTGSFVANQTLTNNQASPAVSALDNGNYVVTWDSNDTSGPDQNGYSVWGRIYAADGTALTSEFLINTATAGDQHLAKVVSRPDGSFVALFMSATDTAPGAGTSGIYAQYFDAAGNKVGQQMQIHQLTYGEQVEVDATFLAGGQLYVTWTDKGVGDGEGSAIKGRVVDLVETLGLEQMTPDNNDPTTIDYQPATTPASSDTDVLPPNVGLSTNTKETLGGQTEAGATVIVTNAAGTVYSTVADAEGVWSIVPNPLSVGENGTLSAIDAAGNQSQPVLISGAALSAYDLLNESAQVNTTTTGDQLNPSVTRLADGRIVVTWQGDGTSGTEVYMQLYEADGVHKIGTEQQVNQRTANNQDSPQVIALTDGGFLIVYESNVNGLDNSGDGVMARRYGADGQAVTDEFQVNTTYSGAQNRPGAMATADGGYIISWEDQGTGIVQRSYGADNQPVTGEVTVATGKGMGSSGGPEMAAFTDAAHGGMYVTVWNATSGPGDTSGSGVVGQIFAADGTPLGGNFQVNTTTDSSQNYPDVITLNDGSIVVFWDSSDSGTSGSDIRAVHYRVDAATGTLTLVGSGDFIVNSYTSGKQYKPVGVALDDGGYLLIWGSEGGDGDGSAIYAQRFDANDNRVGREFLVNTTTSGNQGSAINQDAIITVAR